MCIFSKGYDCKCKKECPSEKSVKEIRGSAWGKEFKHKYGVDFDFELLNLKTHGLTYISTAEGTLDLRKEIIKQACNRDDARQAKNYYLELTSKGKSSKKFKQMHDHLWLSLYQMSIVLKLTTK
eukprot:Awhi_evm1s10654